MAYLETNGISSDDIYDGASSNDISWHAISSNDMSS
jgi:hypothetical protein